MKALTARKVLRGVTIGLVPCLPLLVVRLWHWIVLGGIAGSIEGLSFAELNARIFEPYAWIDPLTVTSGWVLLGAVYFGLRWPKAGSDYANWLRTVPWSATKPLPKGPLTPSLTAWIAVATSMAVAGPVAGISLLLPPLAFLLGWLFAALLTTAHEDSWWVAFVPATALLLALATPRPLWPALITALATVFFLKRRLLATIDRRCREPLSTARGNDILCHHQAWLHPQGHHPRFGVPSRGRFASAIVVGLAFALPATWEWRFTQSVEISAMLLGLATTLAALTRCVAYLIRLRPPLNWIGRLRRGRLVIPGYDRALVTPLLMLITLLPAAAIGLFEDHQHGLFGIPIVGITAAVITALFLCGGPSLSSWLLTAPGRLSAPAQTSTTTKRSSSRKGHGEIQSYC